MLKCALSTTAEPAKIEKLTKALLDMGKLIDVGEGIILHRSSLQTAEDKLIAAL